MNLFACEDNVFKWSQTDPESAEGIRPLADWAKLFSADLFRRRLDKDYLEKMAGYRKQMGSTMVELGMTGPWFMRPRD
ncbi:MAG: hypothetical protein IZT58_12215 [Actinobacteria bacterium]|jgi:hypothetical protein|nr:hypothetical protein [Actinomycetota bacterium]